MCNSPRDRISTIQLFAMDFDALRGCVSKLEAAGYRVQFVPGQPALWLGDYEVVGQHAVAAFVEHLLSPGQAPTP